MNYEYGLPADYVMPEVGARDQVGHANTVDPYRPICSAVVHGYLCTLPRNHKCRFHVAHGIDSVVIATLLMDQEYLRVQDGL